jgi:PAT family beta-lactamase induction signal transducer AmpG
LLASQLLILLGLVAMAATDPRAELTRLVALAVLVAFSSATQDIIIDAYRIEIGEARLQATFAAAYMMGYRLAMILASAGVLWISAAADLPEAGYQQSSWAVAYLIMASAMGVGILTTLTAPEPNVAPRAASERRGDWAERLRDWLWRVVVAPFAEFLRRYGWRAVLLLALIGTYRISDVVLGVVANVFYLDMGFSKEEIADVTKVFGILMTLLGAALGGGLVTRFGVMPILMLGGALSAATNLMFIQLAGVGHELPMLMVTVGLDNLSAGIASAAFVAYLSGLTNVAFSATQYALFSSVMLVLPKFVGGFSGVMVEGLGYPGFFALTAALGIPVLVLLALAWRVAPVNGVNGER